MADEYKTGPGSRLVIRVDKPKQQGQSGQGQPGGGQARKGPEGFLDPPRLARDIFPPEEDDELYFYDLATVLNPAGQASYSELKGVLNIPEPGLSYSSADHIAWEAQMLGSLLSGDPQDVDPTGLTVIESSPRGRRASNRWLWNRSVGTNNQWPAIGLRLKPGQPSAPFPLREENWKSVDITGEEWASSNTQGDHAPDYGFWRIPHKERYEHVTSSDARYMQFDTRDVALYSVSKFPQVGAEETPFKIDWPLKVYGVPRVYKARETTGSTVVGAVERSVTRVTETGSGTWPNGQNYTYQIQLTELTRVVVAGRTGTFIPAYFIEEGRHAAARPPLFPKTYIPTVVGQPLPEASTPEYFVAQHLPPSVLKLRREFGMNLVRRNYTHRVKLISNPNVAIPLGDTDANVTRTVYDTSIVMGRRPTNDPSGELRARVEAEMAQEFGMSYEQVLVSGPQTDGSYVSASSSLVYNGGNVAPAAAVPFFEFFGNLPRAGELCAVIVAGGKKFYVRRKTSQ